MKEFRSLASRVDGTETPFVLVHGLDDLNTAPEQSRAFAEVLEDAKVDAELMPVPYADHGAIIRSEESFEAVAGFLATVLGQTLMTAFPASEESTAQGRG